MTITLLPGVSKAMGYGLSIACARCWGRTRDLPH